MFRKLIALISVLPISCFAIDVGPYIGIGIGADTTNFDIKTNPTVPGDFMVTNTTQESAVGVLGNIFAGYSWSYDWFYVAAEINGSLSSAQFETTNNEQIHHTYSKTTQNIDSAWGIGMLPGILWPQQDALLYTRIGYVQGYLQVDTTDTSLKNIDFWTNGLRLGLGIEKTVYQNWDIRLEYSHISYEEKSSSVHITSSNFSKTTDITPSSNQFELDVIYRI